MDDSAPERSSQDMVRYAVAISSDRDGFLRRSCASCGRDFKTEINESDLQWALAFQVQRMGLEIGGDTSQPSKETRQHLRCPYCAFEGDDQEMHTDATINYMKRVIYRECMMPKLNQFFSGLEDIFGGRGSGGLVSLRFEHNPLPKPVRPIHGPEPPDMDIVEFICCAKKIKVSQGWADIRTCPFCSAQVRIV